MEIENLKNLSISNLILIILNDKNDDVLRQYAEIELKARLKNVSYNYNDILNLDDKVIKMRGLDIDNYLISPNVNMQQFMETYFKYYNRSRLKNYDLDKYDSLLFSEKHLIDERSFRKNFFSKLCNAELKNINKRINNGDYEYQKELLLEVKKKLENRIEERKLFKELIKDQGREEGNFLDSILSCGEAMNQLWGDPYLSPLNNISDEEFYKLLRTKLGKLKLDIAEKLDESDLFHSNTFDDLYGILFVSKDSSKLKLQKKLLLQQARNGYRVNYDTDTMKESLKNFE